MNLSKFGLLFLIFLDVFGPSLILPIINALVMGSKVGFLPAETTMATRHFDFGMVISVFDLSRYLGAIPVVRGITEVRASDGS